MVIEQRVANAGNTPQVVAATPTPLEKSPHLQEHLSDNAPSMEESGLDMSSLYANSVEDQANAARIQEKKDALIEKQSFLQSDESVELRARVRVDKLKLQTPETGEELQDRQRKKLGLSLEMHAHANAHEVPESTPVVLSLDQKQISFQDGKRVLQGFQKEANITESTNPIEAAMRLREDQAATAVVAEVIAQANGAVDRTVLVRVVKGLRGQFDTQEQSQENIQTVLEAVADRDPQDLQKSLIGKDASGQLAAYTADGEKIASLDTNSVNEIIANAIYLRALSSEELTPEDQQILALTDALNATGIYLSTWEDQQGLFSEYTLVKDPITGEEEIGAVHKGCPMDLQAEHQVAQHVNPLSAEGLAEFVATEKASENVHHAGALADNVGKHPLGHIDGLSIDGNNSHPADQAGLQRENSEDFLILGAAPVSIEGMAKASQESGGGISTGNFHDIQRAHDTRSILGNFPTGEIALFGGIPNVEKTQHLPGSVDQFSSLPASQTERFMPSMFGEPSRKITIGSILKGVLLQAEDMGFVPFAGTESASPIHQITLSMPHSLSGPTGLGSMRFDIRVPGEVGSKEAAHSSINAKQEHHSKALGKSAETKQEATSTSRSESVLAPAKSVVSSENGAEQVSVQHVEKGETKVEAGNSQAESVMQSDGMQAETRSSVSAVQNKNKQDEEITTRSKDEAVVNVQTIKPEVNQVAEAKSDPQKVAQQILSEVLSGEHADTSHKEGKKETRKGKKNDEAFVEEPQDKGTYEARQQQLTPASAVVTKQQVQPVLSPLAVQNTPKPQITTKLTLALNATSRNFIPTQEPNQARDFFAGLLMELHQESKLAAA